MPKTEKRSTFFETAVKTHNEGCDAYKNGTLPEHNPHTGMFFHLWQEGYDAARRIDEEETTRG